MGSADSGNKARGLDRLRCHGFAVPDLLVFPADVQIDELHVWSRVQDLSAIDIDERGAAALAVRSSAIAEDNADASGAGRFASLIGTFTPGELVCAIDKVRSSGGPSSIPVIVQVAIQPRTSGVAFSCDPVSFDRAPFLVSWVDGGGQDLVAGRRQGELVVARSSTDYDGFWPCDQSALADLISALGVMESDFQRPADIEWAVDKSGQLWLLQARPVVLPHLQLVDARSGPGLAALPGVIAGHSKVRLRLASRRANVLMSDAVILTASADASGIELPTWLPSPRAAGLSIVLLHPCRTQNKVQREFAQVDGFDVPFFTSGCRRYAIRRYPWGEGAAAVARDVLARGLDWNWLAGVVVQEIYDAAATGIVRKLGSDFVAELAVGHFVPKGVVDTSLFIVSQTGDVLESRRVEQDVAYRFINGHVVTERPLEEQLQLSDDEIGSAVLQIAPMFSDYPNAALEFGILKDRQGGEVRGYVIDVAESDSQATADRLDPRLVRDGVLSPGRAEGRALRVANADDAELDTHLLEQFEATGESIRDAVLVADRASVDLLPLVGLCDANVAFVFRRASLLAHLCIVLRERGIPAISLENDDLFGKLIEGSPLTVEASETNWIGPRVN